MRLYELGDIVRLRNGEAVEVVSFSEDTIFARKHSWTITPRSPEPFALSDISEVIYQVPRR